MFRESNPLFRMLLRFFALPYCYFNLVNWEECQRNRLRVIFDLLYIFFVLKYYPYNYSLCRLWEKDRVEWAYYYSSIYEPYQRYKLRKEVHKKEYEIIFEDKYVCYQICNGMDIPQPKLFAYVRPGSGSEKAIDRLIENSNTPLIVKPTRGKGGKDIVIIKKSGERWLAIKSGEVTDLKDWKLTQESIVQEYVTQHQALTEVSPSINTVRIVTMLTVSNEVIILGAFMRFGVADKYIDNTSIGGLAVKIDPDTAVLSRTALDFSSRTYDEHPVSGQKFEGFVIPHFHKVVALAKKVQSNFPYHRMMGLDIAIREDGPMLIEINAAHDNIGLEQQCGPLLANRTIYEEFKRYELLINKKQKQLYS